VLFRSGSNSEAIRRALHPFINQRACRSCQGMRLKASIRAVKLAHQHESWLGIQEFCALPVETARHWLGGISLVSEKAAIAVQILTDLEQRLSFLEDVGLGDLSLNRRSSSLSGGESQRIRLASQLGSGLSGVLYVLDEPSIGLHQRDNRKLIETLTRLRDLGNTLIVVEHDEDTIRTADWIVDIGPGAGEHGGKVVSSGSYEDLIASKESITGAYLSGKSVIAIPKKRRAIDMKKSLTVKDAKENNLQNIDVTFPLAAFIAVTGVSGSGKSTLVNDILYSVLANKLNGARIVPGRHRTITGLDQS